MIMDFTVVEKMLAVALVVLAIVSIVIAFIPNMFLYLV